MTARLPFGRTLYSRAVLLDTGALVALAHSRDVNHQFAANCLLEIQRHRLPVFMTVPTIYESHKRILFDLGRQRARRFLSEIYDGSVSIVRTVEQDEIEAQSFLDQYADLTLTLTDAANMAVMARLKIAASFSFDKHYLQAGFIRIPPFHL